MRAFLVWRSDLSSAYPPIENPLLSDSGSNRNRFYDGLVRLGRVIELAVKLVNAFAVAQADGVDNRAQMIAGDFDHHERINQRKRLVEMMSGGEVKQGTI